MVGYVIKNYGFRLVNTPGNDIVHLIHGDMIVLKVGKFIWINSHRMDKFKLMFFFIFEENPGFFQVCNSGKL